MLLFKYFKSQKKKESVNELNVEVAEDALVVQDSGKTASLTCTSLNVTSVVNCEPRRVTIGLSQGASDSKVKRNPSTLKPKTTKCRLYPNLEEAIPVSTQSRAAKEQKILDFHTVTHLFKKSVIKPDKTIHDIADDITCILHAKLMVDELNSKFNQLHTDITNTVTLISPSVGLPTYEYNFDNELEFKKQNINQFNDAEKYHENVCKNQKNSTPESSQNIIIFKKYHQSFKSYKGRNCDVIDCD